MIAYNKQQLFFVSLLPALSLDNLYTACFLHFLSTSPYAHISICLQMEAVYSLVEFLHGYMRARMNFLCLILTNLKTVVLNGSADTTLTKAVWTRCYNL